MKYYQCPECGNKQRSQAKDRIECHRCGKQYKRRTAKVTTKAPGDGDPEGFITYMVEDDDDE